ncbi:UNVERIFIED_ORG: hypothetical protein BDK47_12745 [Anoxybacillus amylolyticus]|nr:hypothetical protein GA8_17025 [Geobacillus sp. A8]
MSLFGGIFFLAGGPGKEGQFFSRKYDMIKNGNLSRKSEE